MSLQFRANLARSQRTPDFHKHSPASLGEAGLAAVSLAVDQFEQVVSQHLFAEEIRQSANGLLHSANAPHDLGTLPYELEEFFVRRLHHLLRRNAVGLRININGVRTQATAVIFPNVHKPLLPPMARPLDSSLLVFYYGKGP